MRIRGRNLNHLKTALAQRSAILRRYPNHDGIPAPITSDDHPYGEDVKMVRQHKLQCRLLTPTEKDEAIAKYLGGMSMTEVAEYYGCHYTTIGRLLRAKGAGIR